MPVLGDGCYPLLQTRKLSFRAGEQLAQGSFRGHLVGLCQAFPGSISPARLWAPGCWSLTVSSREKRQCTASPPMSGTQADRGEVMALTERLPGLSS